MRTTLIISVYNKTRELELIFCALLVQSFRDFEVIVSEDGENVNMKLLIDKWRQKNEFPLLHLTQEDKGFRKNKILNESVKKSSSEYLIFFDGDCIPHPDFVKAHFENRNSNSVLCGRRVNLTKSVSEKINEDSIANLDYSRLKLSQIIYSSLNRDKNDFNFNIEEGFIFRNRVIRKLFTNEDEHLLGCNFSVHKTLLEKINGFDENYEGPGLGEDSDVEFRLRLAGAVFKSVRNLAVQYHMYHPKTIEDVKNMKYFNEAKKSKNYICKNGLVKYE
ncbi:MAG: glycosyltransferase [Bacteroidetes bacterium]|nr:glycosyltransferase [Bacteroidota bacterium]